jgi:hypothetical protein
MTWSGSIGSSGNGMNPITKFNLITHNTQPWSNTVYLSRE